MKKTSRRIKNILLLISCLSIIIIFTSCENTNKTELKTIETGEKLQDFVYIEDSMFKINDTVFEAMMLNYVISFYDFDNEILCGPFIRYEDYENIEYSTKDSLLWQLEGHFKIAREMGFNTLRICMDRLHVDEKGDFFVSTENSNTKFYLDKYAEQIIDGVVAMVQCATNADMKLMLLLKHPLLDNKLYEFTEKLLAALQDKPTVFAYDLYNEPLYFEKIERKKTDVYKQGQQLVKLMKNYAPHQLSTIGFAEPIEAFFWDPSIIDIDFVTFHSYNPLRFESEVYWFNKYIDKPWMLGETGFHTDSTARKGEIEQFLWETMQVVKNYGGMGYAWWEFQDVIINMPGHTHYGMLTHGGKGSATTSTKDSTFTMSGTVKPAAKLISEYFEMNRKATRRPPTYFNMLGYKNILIKGKVIDSKTNKPIEGAVIRAWNEYWDIGSNTFTDENGNFTVYSNDEIRHIAFSAPRYSFKKINIDLEYNDKKGNKVDLSKVDLADQKLEYQSIDFRNYLSDSSIIDSLQENYILVMDTTKFSKYQYVSEIKQAISLKRLF